MEAHSHDIYKAKPTIQDPIIRMTAATLQFLYFVDPCIRCYFFAFARAIKKVKRSTQTEGTATTKFDSS
jgi:hypothetical protein